MNINTNGGALALGTYKLIGDSSSTTPTGGTGWAVGTNTATNPAGTNYSIGVVGKNLDLTVSLAITWGGEDATSTPTSASWDSGSTSNWYTNVPAPITFANGANVTFGDTQYSSGPPVTNTSVVVANGGVSPASVTFTNTGATNGGVNYTFSDSDGSHGIVGSAPIMMSGTGTVFFTSPNTGFTGSVSITGGQIDLEASGALGSSTGVTVSSGAALQLQGGITTNNILLTINGPGLASPGTAAGALQSVSGGNTYSGAIQLGSPATIKSSNPGDTLTLTGGITKNGNLLTIDGPGNVTISTNPIGAGIGGLTFNGEGSPAVPARSRSAPQTSTPA